MDIDIQIWIIDPDRWPFTDLLIEIIDDGVFCPVSDKFGMVKILRIDDRIDRKGFLKREIFLPFHLLDLLIDRVRVFRLKMINRFQYTQGRATTKIRLIQQLLITRKRNHTPPYLQIVGA